MIPGTKLNWARYNRIFGGSFQELEYLGNGMFRGTRFDNSQLTFRWDYSPGVIGVLLPGHQGSWQREWNRS